MEQVQALTAAMQLERNLRRRDISDVQKALKETIVELAMAKLVQNDILERCVQCLQDKYDEMSLQCAPEEPVAGYRAKECQSERGNFTGVASCGSAVIRDSVLCAGGVTGPVRAVVDLDDAARCLARGSMDARVQTTHFDHSVQSHTAFKLESTEEFREQGEEVLQKSGNVDDVDTLWAALMETPLEAYGSSMENTGCPLQDSEDTDAESDIEPYRFNELLLVPKIVVVAPKSSHDTSCAGKFFLCIDAEVAADLIGGEDGEINLDDQDSPCTSEETEVTTEEEAESSGHQDGTHEDAPDRLDETDVITSEGQDASTLGGGPREDAPDRPDETAAITSEGQGQDASTLGDGPCEDAPDRPEETDVITSDGQDASTLGDGPREDAPDRPDETDVITSEGQDDSTLGDGPREDAPDGPDETDAITSEEQDPSNLGDGPREDATNAHYDMESLCASIGDAYMVEEIVRTVSDYDDIEAKAEAAAAELADAVRQLQKASSSFMGETLAGKAKADSGLRPATVNRACGADGRTREVSASKHAVEVPITVAVVRDAAEVPSPSSSIVEEAQRRRSRRSPAGVLAKDLADAAGAAAAAATEAAVTARMTLRPSSFLRNSSGSFSGAVAHSARSNSGSNADEVSLRVAKSHTEVSGECFSTDSSALGVLRVRGPRPRRPSVSSDKSRSGGAARGSGFSPKVAPKKMSLQNGRKTSAVSEASLKSLRAKALVVRQVPLKEPGVVPERARQSLRAKAKSAAR